MEQKKKEETKSTTTPAKGVAPKVEKKNILELLEEDDEFEVFTFPDTFFIYRHSRDLIGI
jgi:hypothetical protein